MKLTVAKIRAARPAEQTTGHRRHSRYGDGRGLWLMVDPNGRKSWAFFYTIDKRRRQMGLGPVNERNLADDLDAQRDEALRLRKLVKQGIDPLAERDALRASAPSRSAAAIIPTFEAVAGKVIAQRTATMTNRKAQDQWTATLKTYVYPTIGSTPVNQITPSDLSSVLEAIWDTKNETASRVRQRVKTVLDYAARHDWIEEAALAKLSRTMADFKKRAPDDVEGHKAMPAEQAPAFMARLRDKAAISAKALQFLILTAGRSGQVRGATWSEIDMDRALWTVPKDRMKKRHSDHRVPLSPEAIALLKSLHKEEQSDLLFPSPTKPGTPVSDNTLNKIMSEMGEEAVPHGFRATFSTWAANRGYDSQVIEAALHHKDTNKVRAAYQRTDFLERRTPLMAHWSAYLIGPEAERAFLASAGGEAAK
jgi:integrase